MPLYENVYQCWGTLLIIEYIPSRMCGVFLEKYLYDYISRRITPRADVYESLSGL